MGFDTWSHRKHHISNGVQKALIYFAVAMQYAKYLCDEKRTRNSHCFVCFVLLPSKLPVSHCCGMKTTSQVSGVNTPSGVFGDHSNMVPHVWCHRSLEKTDGFTTTSAHPRPGRVRASHWVATTSCNNRSRRTTNNVWFTTFGSKL